MDYTVKKYLPINEKLKLCENVLNYSNDGNNFAISLKVEMFTLLEIIRAYAGIEVNYETAAEEFDKYYEDGTIASILDQIPDEELNTIFVSTKNAVDSYYKFRNSALGILETISADYSELGVKSDDIQQKLADPNNLTLVKDILTKLG